MSGRRKANTPCNHGKRCNMVNTEAGCPYLHPSSHTFCPHGPTCNLANSGCKFRHSKGVIKCRRGAGCRVESCRYRHPCARGGMCKNRGLGKSTLVAQPFTHNLMWACCFPKPNHFSYE